MEKLADCIWDRIGELSDTVSGSELSSKFAQDTNNFKLAFGNLSTFFGGLEALIGSPNPNVRKAMHTEHCEEKYSSEEWTTGNYGIKTTPRTEWEFIVTPDSEVTGKTWPSEQTLIAAGNTRRCRTYTSLKSFEVHRIAINVKLETMQEELVTEEEVVGVRLYTGPMFEKYNAVNRGGALNTEQVPFMKKQFEDKCRGNRYTTTIHVINSALIKLSKLQKAETVYRGVEGGILPENFWHKTEFGVCGGVEFGFLSTTLNPDVAKTYAKSGGRAATMFEIKMGMVDRGADISGFSQYPHEQEICFAPLTGIEVEGTRVEGSVLVVQARLNINLAAMTIEQVVFKRKKLVVDMCANLQLETENVLSGIDEPTVDQLLRDQGLLSAHVTLRKYCLNEFKKVREADPEVFNNDAQFREKINHTLSIKEFAFPTAKVDATKIEALGRAGTAGGVLVGLIANRLGDTDP